MSIKVLKNLLFAGFVITFLVFLFLLFSGFTISSLTISGNKNFDFTVQYRFNNSVVEKQHIYEASGKKQDFQAIFFLQNIESLELKLPTEGNYELHEIEFMNNPFYRQQIRKKAFTKITEGGGLSTTNSPQIQSQKTLLIATKGPTTIQMAITPYAYKKFSLLSIPALLLIFFGISLFYACDIKFKHPSSIRFMKIFGIAAAAFLILLLFTNFFAQALKLGGRWDIGNTMAVAERFRATGVFSYDTTKDFLATAFYFPGAIYISLISESLIHQYREELVILCAVLLCIGFALLSARLFPSQKPIFAVSSLLCVALLSFNFHTLRIYAGEMHPDSPVLFFALGATFLFSSSERQTNKGKKLYLMVLAVILLAIAGSFKQSSAFIFMGLGLYYLLRKDFLWKKKIIYWGLIGISGVIVLAQVFLIPACFKTTVSVFSKQPYIPLATFFSYAKTAAVNTWLFLILLLCFYLLLASKKISLTTPRQKMWFIAAHLWCFAAVFSALKIGGNAGNIEAGLLALLPFAFQAGIFLYRSGADYMEKKHYHEIYEKTFCLVFLLAVFFLGYWQLKSVSNDLSAYRDRISEQKQMCDFLNKHYKGKSIAISSNYYFFYADSDIQAHTATDFMPHSEYINAGLASEQDFLNLYEQKRWELLILPADIIVPNYPNLLKHYRLCDSPELPTKLKKVVYVRKHSAPQVE